MDQGYTRKKNTLNFWIRIIPENMTHLTFVGSFNQPLTVRVISESVIFVNNKCVKNISNK